MHEDETTESETMLERVAQPVRDILEHLNIGTVSVIETRSVDEVHSDIFIVHERYIFDIGSAFDMLVLFIWNGHVNRMGCQIAYMTSSRALLSLTSHWKSQ